MPNWTENTIVAKKSLIEKYINDKNEFDFNLIIPMPESLNVEAGGSNDTDILVYLTDKLSTHYSEIDSDLLRGIYSSHIIPVNVPKLYKTIQQRVQNNGIDLEKSYEKGKVLVDNYLLYNYTNWYDWSCNNWGTKWNACDTYLPNNWKKCKKGDEIEVSFSTAWSAPYAIFEKILNDNPTGKIKFMWVDEDYDGEHYYVRYKNGNVKQG